MSRKNESPQKAAMRERQNQKIGSAPLQLFTNLISFF